ncbi:MAG: hypothetical protein KAU95_00645 [Candidatus Aenigmarchaeota archaeon]|nr:hypothetical protein [Candidatus Aenigmarchaeota archaeon]
MESNMKIYLLCILLTLFILPVNADTIHRISFAEDSVIIESTLILESDDLLDYWSLSLNLPNNSEIINLSDELGEIEYNISNSKLSFRTNRKRTTIRVVNLSFSKKLDEKFGLKLIDLNLFGFKNDTTIAISEKTPYFFAHDAEMEFGKEIKARKKGGINVRMIFGGKQESDYYFTNSDLDLNQIDDYCWIIEGVTNLKTPVKFAIIMLPDKEYNLEVEEWSAGTYSEGLIYVRENSSETDRRSTILHETTHGFNSFALDWDKTDISWFDEGMACYVGSVVYRLLNETRPEIFGEDIKWREGITIYTLKPQQTPEDLYNYHKSGEEWMLDWYPKKGNREFGYAYSELFVREYLFENGSAMHKVYENLLKINKSIEDPEERNELIAKLLGKKVRPCYSETLEEVRNCASKLNHMSFSIPEVEGKNITHKIEIPKPIIIEEESQIKSFLGMIKELFNNILTWISNNI